MMPTSAPPKATKPAKPKSPEERRAALEARRAKLDLRIRALATEERERRRREDTRAKIVLGGALLAFFRRDFHPWRKDNRSLIAAWTAAQAAPRAT